jgi:hypothetical protein
MEPAETNWRWWAVIALCVFFPIVFKPWWLAIISIVVFCFLVAVLYPRKRKSEL